MKHVRCRDLYALWLFTRQVTGTAVRWIAKLVLRRPTNNYYLRGLFRGARGSFRFGVDRSTRLYVER
jgi:hypothetical protein